ncbi:OmpA family protein [Pseudomonas sp. PDM13]|uniref:OmpA family protein n=1 Tax=Pseudomonas sp. PDM13 TaxID=2769255 RepID=UPI0021E04E44|nr:OmpA family protein [Pseudomonas sp. PDM13]MCU9949063.1 OmpA family protein [Pseudomonas sp. PDM13]
MSTTLTLGLHAWVATLALALLFAFPLEGWLRAAAILVGAILLFLLWLRSRRSGVIDAEVPLLAASFQQPVMLVCGDGLPGLFDMADADRPMPRMTQQACYLPVDNLERLPLMVRSILARRPHWHGQLGILLAITPGKHRDPEQLDGHLRTFRHQLMLARRHGAALPVIQATYLQSGLCEDSWFSWEAGARQPEVMEAGACSRLVDWQAGGGDLSLAELRLGTRVVLESATGWLRRHVLPPLAGRGSNDQAVEPVACGVTLVPELHGRVAGNLWQQWVHDHTALIEADKPDPGLKRLLPLPEALLPLLSLKVRSTPLWRAASVALWVFTAAALLALMGSAWHNQRLAHQVGDDLHRYLAIPLAQDRNQPEFALREEAMAVLRADAARLDGYYRRGEPIWLGFGLYQGERLRRELHAVIRGYRLPQQLPVAEFKVPEPVRLDSLSLFSVGSSTLKPESTKFLINALVDVKAQPGWLIVIAGHTDATGNVEHNLQLSRARAAAVRDWMQRMGDIPDSCFAVQGFGSDQPIASNDTEIGRAVNRRVDIRLVPEAGACAPSAATPGGKGQPHSAAVNL